MRDAVTFDFGQVLASFDPAFLVEKLRERGEDGDVARFEAALPVAWHAYGIALREGGHGAGAWKTFLRTVLVEGGSPGAAKEDLLDWLFVDQKRRNLWQKPVEGMIDVVRDLRRRGVPVAILSNSEGKLVELVAKLGWTGDFPVIADSGVLGFEKPGRAIFEWTADRLGVAIDRLVHVGDSWAADVEGALGVGARAVWFPAADERELDRSRVLPARSVDDVRRAIASFGT